MSLNIFQKRILVFALNIRLTDLSDQRRGRLRKCTSWCRLIFGLESYEPFLTAILRWVALFSITYVVWIRIVDRVLPFWGHSHEFCPFFVKIAYVLLRSLRVELIYCFLDDLVSGWWNEWIMGSHLTLYERWLRLLSHFASFQRSFFLILLK